MSNFMSPLRKSNHQLNNRKKYSPFRQQKKQPPSTLPPKNKRKKKIMSKNLTTTDKIFKRKPKRLRNKLKNSRTQRVPLTAKIKRSTLLMLTKFLQTKTAKIPKANLRYPNNHKSKINSKKEQPPRKQYKQKQLLYLDRVSLRRQLLEVFLGKAWNQTSHAVEWWWQTVERLKSTWLSFLLASTCWWWKRVSPTQRKNST